MNYLDEQGLNTYDTLIKSYVRGVMSERSEIPSSLMAVINGIDSKVDTVDGKCDDILTNYVTKTDLQNALANVGGSETITVSAESGMYVKITSGNTVIKQSAVDGDIVTIPFGVQYEWELYNSSGVQIFSGNGVASILSETIDTKPKSVDLGLPSGKLWAAYNVGAESFGDPGLYFSWGSIEGHAKGSEYSFSSSNYGSRYGTLAASFTPGDEEYDAARFYMGGDWCMPTKDDFTELLNNCTIELASVSSVKGYKFSRNGNYIFLPVTGVYNGTSLLSNTTEGRYWSTDYYDLYNAYNLYFYTGSTKSVSTTNACYGIPIRAVKTPQS